MGDFNNDLKLSQSFEDEVAAHYQNFYNATTTQNKGKFSDYDIEVKPCTVLSFTIEIKYDRQAWRTGNISVEIKSKNRNGEEWASGLSSTKADYYLFGFDRLQEVYSIRVDRLKQMVKEEKYFRLIDYAGDGWATIVLFKLDDFLKECRLVFRRQKETNARRTSYAA